MYEWMHHHRASRSRRPLARASARAAARAAGRVRAASSRRYLVLDGVPSSTNRSGGDETQGSWLVVGVSIGVGVVGLVETRVLLLLVVRVVRGRGHYHWK